MPEEDKVDPPVELDTAPAPDVDPVPFNVDSEMPLGGFPEGMRESLKGKSIKDFSVDHAKMRKGFQQLGEKNKGLEAELAELRGKKPDAADLSEDEIEAMLKDRSDKEMISGPDYREHLNGYFETDEISEEFLDVMTTRGFKPTRRDTLKFLSFLKADRAAKIENINVAANGAVTGQELWDWMESDDCTMSKESLIGLNDLSEEDDFSWVGTMVKKYREWSEGGGTPVKRAGKGRFAGPTRRGRPVPAASGEKDISKDDFQSQWMRLTNQRTAGQITKGEEAKKKRELAALRDRSQ